MPTSQIKMAKKNYKEYKRDSTRILKPSCLYYEVET